MITYYTHNNLIIILWCSRWYTTTCRPWWIMPA